MCLSNNQIKNFCVFHDRIVCYLCLFWLLIDISIAQTSRKQEAQEALVSVSFDDIRLSNVRKSTKKDDELSLSRVAYRVSTHKTVNLCHFMFFFSSSNIYHYVMTNIWITLLSVWINNVFFCCIAHEATSVCVVCVYVSLPCYLISVTLCISIKICLNDGRDNDLMLVNITFFHTIVRKKVFAIRNETCCCCKTSVYVFGAR